MRKEFRRNLINNSFFSFKKFHLIKLETFTRAAVKVGEQALL